MADLKDGKYLKEYQLGYSPWSEFNSSLRPPWTRSFGTQDSRELSELTWPWRGGRFLRWMHSMRDERSKTRDVRPDRQSDISMISLFALCIAQATTERATLFLPTAARFGLASHHP
eukprot:scaffold1584_cov259-Pinguiococcus_pyrenoidosus.AAC.2